MGNYIQVVTTTSNRGSAEEIADSLVTKKLAACVQIVGPIKSVFMWEKQKTEVEEWMCLIKTKKSMYKRIERQIISLHKYETPEILSFSIESGNKKYLKWLDGCLR